MIYIAGGQKLPAIFNNNQHIIESMGKTYRAGSSHNKFSRRDFDKKSKFFKKFKQKDKHMTDLAGEKRFY